MLKLHLTPMTYRNLRTAKHLYDTRDRIPLETVTTVSSKRYKSITNQPQKMMVWGLTNVLLFYIEPINGASTSGMRREKVIRYPVKQDMGNFQGSF